MAERAAVVVGRGPGRPRRAGPAAERDGRRRAAEMRLEACPNNCGESIAHCRMKDHIANFCGNPFFVAQRRMIRKYRHVKKYARPWATGDDAKDVEYVSSEDEYSDDDR